MISVIVPVYNVAQYLDDCVNSIINQTYKDLQIILIDDGSTDDSGCLCDKFASLDNRIIVIHKKNGGLSQARNAGLDVATGEFIGFVDSDDYISLDMYQRLYDAMLRHPEAGVTSVSILTFNDGKNDFSPMRSDWVKTSDVFTSPERYCCSTISNITDVMVWNKLYRKVTLVNVKFLEGRNNEDARFQFDLSRNLETQKLGLIEAPGCGYYYRQRGGSIMSNKKVPIAVDKLLNLKDMLQETPASQSIKYNALYKKNVHVLLDFFSDMISDKELKKRYWNMFYPSVKEISVSYVKQNFGKRFLLLLLYLKFFCR